VQLVNHQTGITLDGPVNWLSEPLRGHTCSMEEAWNTNTSIDTAR